MRTNGVDKMKDRPQFHESFTTLFTVAGEPCSTFLSRAWDLLSVAAAIYAIMSLRTKHSNPSKLHQSMHTGISCCKWEILFKLNIVASVICDMTVQSHIQADNRQTAEACLPLYLHSLGNLHMLAGPSLLHANNTFYQL